MESNVTVQERTAERVVRFRTPRGQYADMTIRDGTNDYNTLNACMTEDEYRLRDFHGTGWAVDVGGYLGGVAISLALDNPELRVLVIEPVPDNLRLIAENIERNGLGDRITLIAGAVGDGSPVEVWHSYRGTETAEHHRFVGNSSLAYDHGGELAHETTRYERSLTLADLIHGRMEHNWIDLLKIDCEGGEWTFLAHEWVDRVGSILGEAHSVRGHRGDDIVGLLSATHDVEILGDPAGTVEFWAVAK